MEIKNLITNDTKILDLTNYRINNFLKTNHAGIRKDVIECWDSWYKKDGFLYFFKDFYDLQEQSSALRLLNELIGEELAKSIGLDSIHYEIAKAQDKIGLASESFYAKHNKYYFMQDLYLPLGCCNFKNLERLRDRCRSDDNHKQLVSEILKSVAIDIFMNQKDRKFPNIQFRKSIYGLHYAPMYDFEESFVNPRETVYESDLLRIDTISKTAYNSHPELRDYLDYLFDQGIDKTLTKIEDERKIVIPEEAKTYYKNFVNEREKHIGR